MDNFLFPYLTQPLINLLTIFHGLIPGHDFGIAVILVTVVVRMAVWPLQGKQLRSQRELSKIQPEVKKLQQKYKNDKVKMQAKVMELYKEKEVNPFGSCLPLLVQLPILFALFYAFKKFGDPSYVTTIHDGNGLYADLYGWVKNLSFVKDDLSQTFSTKMFGIIDLAQRSIPMAALAAGVQFLQSKMMMPKKNLDDQQKAMNKMLYFFPILTFAFGMAFPAALPLYWTVTSALTVLQQKLVMKGDIEKLEESDDGSKKDRRRQNK